MLFVILQLRHYINRLLSNIRPLRPFPRRRICVLTESSKDLWHYCLMNFPRVFFSKDIFHHLWEISQPLNGWRSWVWAGIWHLQLIPTLCLALWGDLSPECIVNEGLNIFSKINIKISLVISLHLMSWISVNTNIHLAVIFFISLWASLLPGQTGLLSL